MKFISGRLFSIGTVLQFSLEYSFGILATQWKEAIKCSYLEHVHLYMYPWIINFEIINIV